MAAGGAALADGFQFTSNLSSPSCTMRSSAASSIGSIAIAGSVHSTCTSSYYGYFRFRRRHVIVHSHQFRIRFGQRMCAYAFQRRSAAPMKIGWLETRTAKSCSTFLPAPQSPHQAGIRVLLQWEVSQISMRKTPIDVCSR